MLKLNALVWGLMRMSKYMRAQITLLFAFLSLFAANAFAGDYADIYELLKNQSNRKPASQNFTAAQDAIATKLQQAGLDVQRQRYRTQVPVTKRCLFNVDGEVIEGVYPLGPNNVVPVSTGGAPLSGPLVYVGDASFESLKGIDVKGAIALVDFSSRNMRNVFREGAKAIVFVEDGQATQWSVADHFTNLPFNTPRAYVSRQSAESRGWLKKRGVVAKAASLDIAVVWEDRVASNLWAFIPGEAGATFNLNTEEAVVLSADLSTSGAVPDLAPQLRDAANAALLTETAINLAKAGTLKRSVFVVFTGSHYNLHEGLRYFYYAYERANNTNRETDTLPVRLSFYEEELAELQNRYDVAVAEDFFARKGDDGYEDVVQHIKRLLRSRVSGYNFELLELASKERLIPKENKDEKEAINATIEDIRYQKTIWNDLQRQVSEGEILRGHLALNPVEEGAEDNMVWFKRLTSQLADGYKNAIEQSKLRATFNKDHQKLSSMFASRKLVSHFSFDFADDKNPWLFNATGENLQLVYSQMQPGAYSKMLAGFAKVYKQAAIDFQAAPLYLPSTDGLIVPEFLTTPRSRSLSSTVSAGVKVNGYNLQTLADPLDSDQLPQAVAADLSGLVAPLGALFVELANSYELSLNPVLPDINFPRSLRYERQNGRVKGLLYQTLQRGSNDPEGPADGVLSYMSQASYLNRHPLVGFSMGVISRVNSYGRINQPNVIENWSIIIGIDFDENGTVTKISPNCLQNSPAVNLFYTDGGGFYRYDTPERYDLVSTATASLLKASNDSKYKNSLMLNNLAETVVYKDRAGDSKVLVNGYLLLGSEEEKFSGKGLDFVGMEALAFNATKQANGDYAELNGHRFTALKEKGIINNSIAILDAEREEHDELAEEAAAEGDIALKKAHESFSLYLAHRAYDPLRVLSNDMVKAVVVLMILLLPFAFAMERLLIGSPSIYRQISGFVIIFLLTFAVLYNVHPAFSLADAPLVIFLAFVIILMSSMVIYIVMGKFKVEIRAMQGLVSKAHSAAKESSTAMASVLIGISGMRNRPLKTFLTASTIVLLTFTILVFASFDSQMGVVETYLGGGTGVDRIEIHRPSYLKIPESIQNGIGSIYKDDYEVFERKAGFNDPVRMRLVSAPYRANYALAQKDGAVMELSGLLGFDPREIAINSELGEVLNPLATAKKIDGHYPLMLSDFAQKELGLQVGDRVSIRGVKFQFIAPFNAPKLDGLSSIEASKYIPPNYIATMAEEKESMSGTSDALVRSLESIDVSTFLWLSPSLLAVTSNEALVELDHYTNFITMYPKGSGDIGKTASSIAQIFKGAVFAKDAVGSRKFFYTSSVQGSGFGEVIVPLLLGGLIIFSSLMGSIVDREKEIFTFSALGLAPPDVGTLFFAESAVYSVIGGVGGYLFSQVVAKLLEIMASYGIFYPPEMNFSSLSSIYTILIVMALVMLSTIYPAIKAGKSANPGVARKWQMPEPEGNNMKFIFPFTVSSNDLSGVLSFVFEHFESHSDASLGSFAAQNVQLYQEDNSEMECGHSLGLKMEMALAPFDLGLFQHFKMYSQDSDIPGIMEVVIELERTSGAKAPWMRSNRSFINDLRNQFLLWRSLPVETVEHYCSLTQERLAAK